ncbi:hypothetical protein HUW62_41570 [Myxococcus sp. AM011]|nr:hypothetical protein [Myxococcus sp. AM011]
MTRVASPLSSATSLPVEGEVGAASLDSVPARGTPLPMKGTSASTLEVFQGQVPGGSGGFLVPGPRCGPRTGGSNDFDFAVGGSFPPRPMGSVREQMKQGAFTLAQSEAATASLALMGGSVVEAYARGHLRLLEPSPPIQGAPTSLTDYTSALPGVPPEAAWAYFVRNPGPVFESAGIRLQPPTGTLADGAKVFLEEKGPPPVWAPVAFQLEAKTLTVHITTLDGHPLRGTNRFVFEEDGAGGTRLRQYSAFQGSSPATTVGLKLMDPIERQHDIWRGVHAHLHDTLVSR